MAKKRKTTSSQSNKKKDNSAKCDISDDDGGDKVYDNIDYLDLTEDQNLMSKLGGKVEKKRNQRPNNRLEELYAISGSSDDDLPTVKQKPKKKSKKEDLDSDLDIENNDGEDAIGDGIGVWGGKKQHYYGGNPNEKNFKTKGKDAGSDDEEQMSEAEMEEAEAKIIQAKQLTELDEEDFLDMFSGTSNKESDSPNIDQSSTIHSRNDVNDRVQLDLSKLSQGERGQLFHRESPEFSGILSDFESKLTEAGTRLYPILNLISIGKLPSTGPAADYIRTKHQVILNYCTNIAAYLMFKTRRTNLKFHPITGQLVQYKQLLDQMKPLDKILAPQINDILKAIKRKTSAKEDHSKFKRLHKLIKREKQSYQLSNINKMKIEQNTRDQLTINNKKKQKKSKKLKILGHDGGSQEENLTLDEKTAIQLYAATRKGKMKHLDESEDDSDDGAHENEQQEQDMVSPEKSGTEPGDLEESEDRRGITYQIFKNKGLAPKRNKDQRNPRVKHRHKFEKAKVRRKGQVRTPRTETKKYSGEQSGINMRVKKGVKLM